LTTGLTVLSAVEFDRKVNCRTTEINNVHSERMLATKAQAVELSALQNIPKLSFGPCSVAAQAAGASGRLLGSREP